MPRTYKQGQAVTILIPVVVNKLATDPTTATLTLTDPNGVVTTPALTHTAATGLYSAVIDLTNAALGTYRLKFVGTGTAQVLYESSFLVEATQA